LAPIPYYDMIRAQDHKFSLRLQMVLHAQSHGVRPAARAFGSTPKTVRRWLERFREGGRAALADRSRRPKTCPHQTNPSQEKKVLTARHQVPCFGPRRLKLLFELSPSLGAIARILKQHGLTRKRRTKAQKKNDLRAVKAQYQPFERLQADTKPLYDIPAYWPQMRAQGLPRHQYTIRDVKSGALFIDYANELSTTYATLATKRLLEHLQPWGVPFQNLSLSTDNGSEYGGHDKQERSRGFHAQALSWGITHRFLPPRTPNAHADVESSHGSIEQELFDLETFRSRYDFFQKIHTYQLWWNFARPNFSKNAKTPAQILQNHGLDPRLLLLKPLDLDLHFRYLHPYLPGSHLPVLPVF
jgi:transposase